MVEITTYSLKDLLNILHITRDSWKKRRQEYLDWFNCFFDYEITMQGKNTFFIIKEVFGDYEPLPRKKKSIEVKEYYVQETSKIVKQEPTNTGSNIARNIVATNNKYAHKEGTASVYVRSILKEGYRVDGKVWCKRTEDGLHYEPISEEQITYLNECITQQFKDDKVQEYAVDMYTDYEAGLITKKDFNEAIGSMTGMAFLSAMDRFILRYGFRPMKIPMWVEGAFKE